MAFSALLDTCVLFPQYLCDTLLRIAEDGQYRPLWSEDILTELERNLVEERGLDARQVQRRISAMRRAFVDATLMVISH